MTNIQNVNASVPITSKSTNTTKKLPPKNVLRAKNIENTNATSKSRTPKNATKAVMKPSEGPPKRKIVVDSVLTM